MSQRQRRWHFGFNRKRKNSRKGIKWQRSFSVEMLERREVLTAVTFTAGTGLLTITGDDTGAFSDDKIVVDIVANLVRVRDVNESPLALPIPGGAPAPAMVTGISIFTFGGDDFITLASVHANTPNDFIGIPTNPPPGVFPISIDSGRQDDIVVGSAFADNILGDRGNDELRGGAGNDRLDAGAAGNAKGDQLFGDAGNDTLRGHAGDDWLEGGAGNDNLDGGGGDDTYVWRSIPANGELDTIVEAGGTDTASFEGVAQSLSIDLNDVNPAGRVVAGTALNPALTVVGMSQLENVLGGHGQDTITGTAGNNILQGGSQTDTIHAGGGNDVVVGDGSSDVLNGGAGNDTMSGDGYSSVATNGLLAGPSGNDDLGAPAVLNEASGLVFGRTNANTLWSIEDVGNGTRLYANGVNGASKGWYRLDIALPADSDWEDMAYHAEMVNGVLRRYVYIADIGDNNNTRANVKIYRLEEPQLPANPNNQFKGVIPAAQIQQLTLTYPGGARNAESLMVDPLNGDIHIVNKGGLAVNLFSLERGNQVWGAVNPGAPATPLVLAGGGQPLPIFRTDDAVGGIAPTSADISPDGTQIVVMSDRQIVRFERRTVPLVPGTLQSVQDAIFLGGPAEIVNAAQTGKREAIAFDSSSILPTLYTTSEGLIGATDTPGQDGLQSVAQQIERYVALTWESGSDTIRGDADHDVIFGGGANDYLYGGFGNDVIFGDFVNQSAYASASSGYGTGSGNDYILGEADDDIVDGGMFNDAIYGGIGADTLRGGNGDDTILATNTIADSQAGDGAIDQLFGDAGVDLLYFKIGEDLGTA